MSAIPRDQVAESPPQRHPPKREEATVGCGSLRLSRRGVWRALVLTLVHIVIVVHILHWRATGKTMTPVEPSEAMKTLELGQINAGFILFIILILGTMVFGRFFCGWACHVVAYQDLCGWILKKMGMKPKPFRSRLLVFVPVFAALYMFVWPQVLRLWEGRAFPALSYHLTTGDFWETFPGLWITLLTFGVCGFLIVYLLGNKGFCTYGCPYGAIFYRADKIAPGKIRVTDACEGCGHCTATCTSNVRVHEEVKKYGMVVDAGCMKCMDCVSVCPKGALYYGFGKPSAAKGAPVEARQRPRYDFSVKEEFALAGLFILSFYAYRGLYGSLPLLLSLGLGAVTSYLLLQTARLLYAPNLRIKSRQLRTAGRTSRVGWAYFSVGVALALFVGHSAVWQYNFHEGNRYYDRALAAEISGEEAAEAAEKSTKRLELARSMGFFASAELEAKLGTLYAFQGENELAEPHLRYAVEKYPAAASLRYEFARTLALVGKRAEAIEELKAVVRMAPDLPGAQTDLASALAADGKIAEAVELFHQIIRDNPNDADARMNLGNLLAQGGNLEEAAKQVAEALRLRPGDVGSMLTLGALYAELGRTADARAMLESVLKIDEGSVSARLALGRLLLSDDPAAAAAHLDPARRADPFDPNLAAMWAESIRRAGTLREAISQMVRSRADDTASWYALVHLYLAAGDEESARFHFSRLKSREPNLPEPRKW